MVATGPTFEMAAPHATSTSSPRRRIVAPVTRPSATCSAVTSLSSHTSPPWRSTTSASGRHTPIVPSGWKPTICPGVWSFSMRIASERRFIAFFSAERKKGGNIEPPVRSALIRRPRGVS